MDHGPYLHAAAAAHMGSMAGSMNPTAVSMRPFGHHQPIEIPVKLTPVTGRISRAKKGIPVHFCETCHKNFTRAEHLRRHQLSHETPQFNCGTPGCDRAFYRKDLLERHLQRHEQEDQNGTAQSGSVTESGSSKAQSPEDSPKPSPYVARTPPASAASSDARHSVMSYPSQSASPGSARGGSPMGSPSGPYQTHNRNFTTESYPTQSIPIMSYMTQAPRYPGMPPPASMYHHQQQHQQHQQHPHQHQSIENPMVPPSESAPTGAGAGTGAGAATGTSSSTTSSMPAATDMDGSSSLHQQHNQQHQQQQQQQHQHSHHHSHSQGHLHQRPSNWQLHRSSHSVSPLHQPAQGGMVHPPAPPAPSQQQQQQQRPRSQHPPIEYPEYYTSAGGGASSGGYYPQLMDVGMSFAENAVAIMAPAAPLYSVRSSPPSSQTTSAQISDIVSASASALPPERALDPGGRGEDPAAATASAASAASAAASASAAAAVSAGLASPALPHRLLDAYWERCHLSFPIVHRTLLETATGPDRFDGLRYAMAAIATQYSPDQEERERGNELHEYALQRCIEEVRFDTSWPLPLMQTVFLSELFARFRGRRMANQPSEMFKKVYGQVYRDAYIVDTTDVHRSNGSNREAWLAWLDIETRRRLLAACFVLDVHTSIYFEQPTELAIDVAGRGIPPIPLSCGTAALWESSDPDMWATVAHALGTKSRFLSETILNSLTRANLANYAPFDRAVFMLTDFLRLPRLNSGLTPAAASSSSAAATGPPPSSAQIERETISFSVLYGSCPIANTYLALRHTPLRDLLAVSGDTWVFGRKVDAASFSEHQKRLAQWRVSDSAAAAAVFAARAILSHIRHWPDPTRLDGLGPLPPSAGSAGSAAPGAGDVTLSSAALSHYWSMYVCALICWVFGRYSRRRCSGLEGGPATTIVVASSSSASVSAPASISGASGASAGSGSGLVSASASADYSAGTDHSNGTAAMAWLRDMSGLLSARREEQERRSVDASLAVGLVRRRLESDCLTCRSKLFIEAVGMLRKLE